MLIRNHLRSFAFSGHHQSNRGLGRTACALLRCRVQLATWKHCFNIWISHSLVVRMCSPYTSIFWHANGWWNVVAWSDSLGSTYLLLWQSGCGLSCLVSCGIVQHILSLCLSSFAIRVCVQKTLVPFWGIPSKS